MGSFSPFEGANVGAGKAGIGEQVSCSGAKYDWEKMQRPAWTNHERSFNVDNFQNS